MSNMNFQRRLLLAFFALLIIISLKSCCGRDFLHIYNWNGIKTLVKFVWNSMEWVGERMKIQNQKSEEEEEIFVRCQHQPPSGPRVDRGWQKWKMYVQNCGVMMKWDKKWRFLFCCCSLFIPFTIHNDAGLLNDEGWSARQQRWKFSRVHDMHNKNDQRCRVNVSYILCTVEKIPCSVLNSVSRMSNFHPPQFLSIYFISTSSEDFMHIEAEWEREQRQLEGKWMNERWTNVMRDEGGLMVVVAVDSLLITKPKELWIVPWCNYDIFFFVVSSLVSYLMLSEMEDELKFPPTHHITSSRNEEIEKMKWNFLDAHQKNILEELREIIRNSPPMSVSEIFRWKEPKFSRKII